MSLNAIDTETSRGYCKIIADKNGYCLINSFDNIVKFLLRGKNGSRHYYSFNLGFDRDSILKYLPRDVLDSFLIGLMHVKWGNYEIDCWGKKIFCIKDIRKPHSPIKIVDIAQFFNNEPDHSLDGLSKKFLGSEKFDNPVIRNLKSHQKDWDMDDYILKHFDELGKYCQEDAKLTAQLAEKVQETSIRLFGIDTTEIYSSAGIGEKATIEYIEGLQNYPKMVHKISAEMAKAAYHGGLFITKKRGTFYDITDLDINSAYPFWMFDLPHWGNGKFIQINEPLDSDYYGWFLCEFDCEWIPYSNGEEELIYDILDGDILLEQDFKVQKIYYPEGIRKQVITLIEYRMMKEWGYQCRIIDGYVWRQTQEKYKKPFEWIKADFKRKAEIKKEFGKESMEYMLIKIKMNGTYGKTAQRLGSAKLLNWYYASYITASTRVQIVNFIKKNKLENLVINVATDGLLIQSVSDIKFIGEGEGLGEWERKHWDEALVIGNGMLQLMSKDKSDTRLRGITGRRDYNIRHELQKHRTEKSFVPQITKRGRPIHLVEAIKHHKVFTKEDINIWKSVCRRLDPSSDTKRKWKPFISFDQLLEGNEESKTWQVKEL
jgi:hypothetical protein